MTSIPKTIEVGPYTYKVTLQETADEGQFILETQDILIAPNRGPDATADALFHEVLHAVFAQIGLRNSLGEKREERIVLPLATALLDLLRKNPTLVRYLTSE